MKEITLHVEDQKYKFFLELVKSLDFVKIKKNTGDTKQEVVTNLSHAFEELKAYNQGKVEGIPAKELLDEI